MTFTDLMREWFALGYVTLMAAVSCLGWWMTARNRAETADMLAEVRRCNDDFAEAAALMRYGAVDEAIELLHAHRERLP